MTLQTKSQSDEFPSQRSEFGAVRGPLLVRGASRWCHSPTLSSEAQRGSSQLVAKLAKSINQMAWLCIFEMKNNIGGAGFSSHATLLHRVAARGNDDASNVSSRLDVSAGLVTCSHSLM